MHCLGAVFVWIFSLVFFSWNVAPVMAWTASDTYVGNTVFKAGLTNPQGIIVDADGNVYVADVKIDKYSADGTLLASFGPSGPTDLAFDLNGDILVVDYNGDQIEKWGKDGTHKATYFSAGTGDTQLSYPWQIAVDSQGNVYVAEYDNNRVHKFDSAMNHVGYITGNSGAFSYPEGVAVDGDDNVIVMDSGNNRLQKFTSTGTFVWSITGANGGFNYSEAIRADSEGNIYVADSGNNRVQIYDSSGNFVQQWGTLGSNPGQFNYPFGLGLTESGTLYVTDNNDIQKFQFDRTPATVSITALSGNTTTDTTPDITGTITDSLTALTAIEYSIDGDAYSTCVADDGTIDETSEAYTCTSGTLSTGSHTITIRSTDSKTNTNTGSNLGTYTFSVGTTPSPTPTPTPTPSTETSTNSENTTSTPQIPATEEGNEAGGAVTPTGNSNTGGQEVVVVIEPGTVTFNTFVSANEVETTEITNNLAEYPNSNVVTSGNNTIGIETNQGTAWQVGNILEINYKAYPPPGKEPAVIIPELQNKPSILSLGYRTEDLVTPGTMNNPFSPSTLKLAFSSDGYHWRLLSNSVHDFINKTLSIIQKIGGYYMIVSVPNWAMAAETETEEIVTPVSSESAVIEIPSEVILTPTPTNQPEQKELLVEMVKKLDPIYLVIAGGVIVVLTLLTVLIRKFK